MNNFYSQLIFFYDRIANFLATHTPFLYLTQSLWRDEAFSVLVAEPGGLETIAITAADYNPPLYYLILNIWMKIFGSSEVSIRALSLMFFLGLLIVVYNFSKILFKEKWAVVATLLTGLSPMLVYYGMEARMYSLYAFTTTASMYYFYTTKWIRYILFTVLALYTHPFTLFVPLTQGLYLLFTKRLNFKLIKTLSVPFILYLPWIFIIIHQFQNSKQMWIYPVDLNLTLSVLGNLLIGYDGTPGNLWKYMKTLSLILIVIYLFAFFKKGNLKKYLLFFLWVFLPLVIVLGISYIKPIYVNRYLITVSVAQIFLIIIGISSSPNKLTKKIVTGSMVLIFIFYLFYLPNFIKKVDIRQTFFYINNLTRKNDLILARSPLVFFESLYYSTNRSNVFLYNPEKVKLPGYLGTILIPESKQINTLPIYPQRAYVIYEDGHFDLYPSSFK